MLFLHRMSPDGKRLLDNGTVIFHDTLTQSTIERPNSHPERLGEKSGLVVMGRRWAFLALINTVGGVRLAMHAGTYARDDDATRAVALDSVTMMREPFPVVTLNNFSADQRTRLMLFAFNLELLPGETSSAVTVQAEDSSHRIYSLPVEYVGTVPGFDWMTQIVANLPDEIANAGDMWLTISLRGAPINKALVNIKASP